MIIIRFIDREKTDDDRATTPESLRSSSPASSPPPQWQSTNTPTNTPPRRFISSILGGDIPYGSRGHVLTRAERKEYSNPPIAPSSSDATQFLTKSEKLVLPRPSTPPKTPRVEPPTRVSVIQRVPPSQSQSASRREDKIEVPQTQEPEQVIISFRFTYVFCRADVSLFLSQQFTFFSYVSNFKTIVNWHIYRIFKFMI